MKQRFEKRRWIRLARVDRILGQRVRDYCDAKWVLRVVCRFGYTYGVACICRIRQSHLQGFNIDTLTGSVTRIYP